MKVASQSEKSSLDLEPVRESAQATTDNVPDGGFAAWLQVAAAFCVFMNTAGLFNSFGIFQGFYTQGLLASTSGSDISWIGSLQGCLMLLICIVTGPLYDLGYLHSLVNIGTFAIVFGMMMTSICYEYWQFILAQGVVVGIGNGLLFLPSIAIVPQYFAKRKALASGIVAAGSSIGSIIYPIIFIQLEPSLGFGWAIRIIAFIMLGTSTVTVAGIKARTEPPLKRRKMYDINSFRDPPFLCFCLSMCFGFMGLYVLFFYVELYAMQECHMSEQLAPYTIVLANAGAALGRLGPNFLADKVGPLNFYLPFIFVTGLLAFCWIAVKTSAGLIVFSLVYGFFSASLVSLIAPVTVEISTTTFDVIGTRLGMALAFGGLGLLIGSPVAGALLTSQGWISQQAWAGSLVMACGASLLAVRGLKYGWKSKSRLFRRSIVHAPNLIRRA